MPEQAAEMRRTKHARKQPNDARTARQRGRFVPRRHSCARKALGIGHAARQMRLPHLWVLLFLLAAERGGAFLLTKPRCVRSGGQPAARHVRCTSRPREARAAVGRPPSCIGRLRGGGWRGSSSSLAVKKAAVDEEDALPGKLSPPPIKLQVSNAC